MFVRGFDEEVDKYSISTRIATSSYLKYRSRED